MMGADRGAGSNNGCGRSSSTRTAAATTIRTRCGGERLIAHLTAIAWKNTRALRSQRTPAARRPRRVWVATACGGDGGRREVPAARMSRSGESVVSRWAATRCAVDRKAAVSSHPACRKHGHEQIPVPTARAVH